MGAKGLIIPNIKNCQDAIDAIYPLRFPPDGGRSFGYCNVNNYGKYFDNYRHSANNDIIIILQIEHVEALNNLSAILKLDIDGTLIGPLDLRGSIDMEMDNILFDRLIDQYIKISHENHKSAGLHLLNLTPLDIQKAKINGYSIIAMGTDALFLHESSRRLLNE
jgi:2-dehydro-3-deoxyglucarate aldolase